MIVLSGGVIGRPNPTVLWTDGASNAAATSPMHTFSGVGIGAAHPTRQVFVADFGGSASAVVIGGISAVSVVSAASNTLSLWRAAVPTGTTASVAVTYTGSARMLIGVWAAYNLVNTSPFHTASYAASSTPASAHATTINTRANGILIAASAALVNAGAGGPSWSGASLRNNRSLNTGAIDWVLSSADAQATSAATGATLQTTWTPAVGNVAIVAATFR